MWLGMLLLKRKDVPAVQNEDLSWKQFINSQLLKICSTDNDKMASTPTQWSFSCFFKSANATGIFINQRDKYTLMYYDKEKQDNRVKAVE